MTNKTDKYAWISDIIHTNVVAKLRGRTFANIIDMGTTTGSLLARLREVFTDSRFFVFSLRNKMSLSDSADLKVVTNEQDLHDHSYDLILSVFDMHSMDPLWDNEFLELINKISDTNSTIVFSDIEINTGTANFLISLAKLFNPRLKNIMSRDKVIELLKEKGFDISESDGYKINSVWSAWIILCKKKRS